MKDHLNVRNTTAGSASLRLPSESRRPLAEVCVGACDAEPSALRSGQLSPCESHTASAAVSTTRPPEAEMPGLWLTQVNSDFYILVVDTEHLKRVGNKRNNNSKTFIRLLGVKGETQAKAGRQEAL